MTNEIPSLSATVAALLVGKPQKIEQENGRSWHTAIYKTPTTERLLLTGENLPGDYQANRKYHGGPNKAVCGYFAVHYPHWKSVYGDSIGYGAFGENIVIDNWAEDHLCIGDTLQLGEAIVQVSQPRQPCDNISKRWNAPELPKAMVASNRTGFYLRLLEEGTVGQGDTFTLLERISPLWTITHCNTVMYDKGIPLEELAALRDVPRLSDEWRDAMEYRIQRRTR